MKKFWLLFVLVISIGAQAQQLRLGYLSHNAVLHQMPQYAEAQKNVRSLRAQYEQEAKRSEAEFQRRFQEFMEGQKDFPKTILLKRQSELQSMLETNVNFRIQVQKLIAQAEEDLMGDVKAILNEAIVVVAEQNGFLIVVNTDGDSVPFLSNTISEDITVLVLNQLGISKDD